MADPLSPDTLVNRAQAEQILRGLGIFNPHTIAVALDQLPSNDPTSTMPLWRIRENLHQGFTPYDRHRPSKASLKVVDKTLPVQNDRGWADKMRSALSNPNADNAAYGIVGSAVLPGAAVAAAGAGVLGGSASVAATSGWLSAAGGAAAAAAAAHPVAAVGGAVVAGTTSAAAIRAKKGKADQDKADAEVAAKAAEADRKALEKSGMNPGLATVAQQAGVSVDEVSKVAQGLGGITGFDFNSFLDGNSTLTDADLESLVRRTGYSWADSGATLAFGPKGQDQPNTFWESGSSQPTWRGVEPILTNHAKFGDASANAVERGLSIINDAKHGSKAYSLREALAKPFGMDDASLQATAEKLWAGGYLQGLKIDVTKPFADQYQASAYDPAFQGAWKAWIESSFMDRSKSASAILEDRIAKNAPVLAKLRQQAIDDKVKDALARVSITDPARLRSLADQQAQGELGHGLNVADQQMLADWFSSKEAAQVGQAVAGKPVVNLDPQANLQEKVRADHGAEAEALDQAEVFSMFRSLLGPGGGR